MSCMIVCFSGFRKLGARRWALSVWSVGLICLVACTVLAQQSSMTTAQEKLQKAMQRHIEARNTRGLTEVITLAEQALQEGLDAQEAPLAHQLIASALLQRAQATVASMQSRRLFGPSWDVLRDRALQDLRKAVEHVPDLAEAYKLIYQLCLLPEGDRQLGRKACDEVIRLQANDPEAVAEAYVARARFQDDPQEQLADLRRAAEANPANPQFQQLYLTALLEADKYDEAEKLLRQWMSRSPEDPQPHAALAELLLRDEKRLDEALEVANRAVQLDKQTTRALLVRARVYLMQEDLTSAMNDIQEALKRDPNDILALMMRAQIYLNQENFKAALEDVESVLRLRPGLVMAILMRAQINAQAKRYDHAIRDMELLVQHEPQNTNYKLQLAFYCMANDQPRKAIKILTEILEADNGNWRALRARGDALLSIGKHAEAIRDYNQALTLKPDDSGLLNNLAWVLATSPEDNLRDGRRALELATKACELTQYKEAHILSTLASAYAELGDFENAIKWSTKAVELGEGDQKEQLKKELESYQQRKPFREKQETKEKPDVPQKNLLET